MKKIPSLIFTIVIMLSLTCTSVFAEEYAYEDLYSFELPSGFVEFNEGFGASEDDIDNKAWSKTYDQDFAFFASCVYDNTNELSVKKSTDDEIKDFSKGLVHNLVASNIEYDIHTEKVEINDNVSLKVSMSDITQPGVSVPVYADFYVFTSNEYIYTFQAISNNKDVLSSDDIDTILSTFEYKKSFFEEYQMYFYIAGGVIVLLILLSIIKSKAKQKQQLTISHYDMPDNFKSYVSDETNAPLDSYSNTDYESEMKEKFSQYSSQKKESNLDSLSVSSLDNSLLSKKEDNTSKSLDSLSVSSLDNSLLSKREETVSKDLDNLSVSSLDSSLLSKKEETVSKDLDSLSVSNIDTSSLLAKKEEDKNEWLGS